MRPIARSRAHCSRKCESFHRTRQPTCCATCTRRVRLFTPTHSLSPARKSQRDQHAWRPVEVRSHSVEENGMSYYTTVLSNCAHSPRDDHHLRALNEDDL